MYVRMYVYTKVIRFVKTPSLFMLSCYESFLPSLFPEFPINAWDPSSSLPETTKPTNGLCMHARKCVCMDICPKVPRIYPSSTLFKGEPSVLKIIYHLRACELSTPSKIDAVTDGNSRSIVCAICKFRWPVVSIHAFIGNSEWGSDALVEVVYS